MLQFDKSQATNSNAVWIPTVNTSSGYYDRLMVVYSQSYDNSNGTFFLTTTSSPNAYRNWLIIQNTSGDVPTPSGQYDVEVYTRTEAVEGRWGFTDQVFSTTTFKWGNFGAGNQPADFVYSDRAYVSGSNEQSITQYVSSNENGTYTTYNG